MAGCEEGEEAEVAEDLELLADFGADVTVGGMKRGENLPGKCLDEIDQGYRIHHS